MLGEAIKHPEKNLVAAQVLDKFVSQAKNGKSLTIERYR